MSATATGTDWLSARLALLEREKALTRLRDEVAAQRRALPDVCVEQDYRFDAETGEVRLAEMFAGKSQLIVYHFMLAPGAAPCKSCSFWAEPFDALRVHLAHRDTELAAVSRAPISEITAVRARMGWRFPWYSSGRSSFNRDFGVTYDEGDAGQPLHNFGTQSARKGESPGVSVFVLRDGAVFHTYSAYSRGLDVLNGAYQLLDLTPKGRDEAHLPWSMAWLRLKDEYA